eukprot:TRINITY_DN11450_c0_g1_i3.p1 TRINITY_DN11450_c0_g1~~TRINITY_DN11450_c0_g1_i3.p1  ORF type:complete len:265 (+),score=40.96 TRINITY_DN11450_c0_g1_i3:2-796(+)
MGYGRRMILMIGSNFPTDKKKKENLHYYFIKNMDKVVVNQYFMVFFFKGATSESLSFVRDLYKKMPDKYFTTLMAFYVVQATFWVKSTLFISNTLRANPLQARSVFLDEPTDLDVDKHISGFKWKIHLSQNAASFLQIRSERKSSVDGTVTENTPGARINDAHKRLSLAFSDVNKGRDPASLKKITKQSLQSYPSYRGVPLVMIAMLKYFFKKPNALEIQGIFRLSASNEHESMLEDSLIRGDYDVLYNCNQHIAVAHIFKKKY